MVVTSPKPTWTATLCRGRLVSSKNAAPRRAGPGQRNRPGVTPVSAWSPRRNCARPCLLPRRDPRRRGGGQIGEDELLHPLNAGLAGHLRRKVGAELGLAARPFEEHHHIARDRQREVASVVLLHHGERQIHAGRDAGRGAERPVTNEDLVGIEVQMRVLFAEVAPHIPSAS